LLVKGQAKNSRQIFKIDVVDDNWVVHQNGGVKTIFSQPDVHSALYIQATKPARTSFGVSIHVGHNFYASFNASLASRPSVTYKLTCIVGFVVEVAPSLAWRELYVSFNTATRYQRLIKDGLQV